MWFFTSARICCGVVVGEAQARDDVFGDADADLNVAVEADAVAGDRRVRRLIRGGLANVVQQCTPGQRCGATGRELFQHQHGVDPYIAFRMELGRLGDAAQADDLGQDAGEQAELVEQLEAACGAALGEDLGQLVANALGARPG